MIVLDFEKWGTRDFFWRTLWGTQNSSEKQLNVY